MNMQGMNPMHPQQMPPMQFRPRPMPMQPQSRMPQQQMGGMMAPGGVPPQNPPMGQQMPMGQAGGMNQFGGADMGMRRMPQGMRPPQQGMEQPGGYNPRMVNSVHTRVSRQLLRMRDSVGLLNCKSQMGDVTQGAPPPQQQQPQQQPMMRQQGMPQQQQQQVMPPQQQQQQQGGLELRSARGSVDMSQRPPAEMMAGQRMTADQAALRAAMSARQQQQMKQQQQMQAPQQMAGAQVKRSIFRPHPQQPPGRADAAAFFQQGGVRPPGQQPNMGGQPQRPTGQQRAQLEAANGPQQFMAQLIEKVKAEKEESLGSEAAYERAKKRPLENEERMFWNEPLPARLVAGLTLLEADSSLTIGHGMGGANDIWASLDPMPSPMSCGGGRMPGLLKFGGVESYRMAAGGALGSPQEYLYTECSLTGVVDELATPAALPALCRTLHSLSGIVQKGIWKDECWRLDNQGASKTTSRLTHNKSTLLNTRGSRIDHSVQDGSMYTCGTPLLQLNRHSSNLRLRMLVKFG